MNIRIKGSTAGRVYILPALMSVILAFGVIIPYKCMPLMKLRAQTAFTFHICNTLTAPVTVMTAATDSVMTDIRVGISDYCGRTSIKLKNTKLAMGYCIDGEYLTDAQFSSTSGFTFKPDTGSYYILNKVFPTYDSAKKTVNILKQLTPYVYAASIYRNYWRVYIGGITDSDKLSEIHDLIHGRFGYTYSSLSKDNGYRVRITAQGCTFIIDAYKMKAYPQFKPLTANYAGVRVVSVGDKAYRGRIEVGRYGKGTLSTVNIINLESYLYGVVPSEMTSTWPTEALKAQAVCARSYAINSVGYSADSNYKKAYYMDDTTKFQVYGGFNSESSAATKAVQATKGKTVTYNGKTIRAFYSSTSGGHTEDAYNVWGTETSYLTGVPDIYETSPEKAPWLVAYTSGQIQSKLAAAGLGIGTLKSITESITTESGRILSLKFKGTSGSAVLDESSIRSVLGLYSSKLKVVEKGDRPDTVHVITKNGESEVELSESCFISGNGSVTKADEGLSQFVAVSRDNLTGFAANAPETSNLFYFAGMGYGHGVGMSQSGARGMAEAGFSYEEIIEYYYTGAEVE